MPGLGRVVLIPWVWPPASPSASRHMHDSALKLFAPLLYRNSNVEDNGIFPYESDAQEGTRSIGQIDRQHLWPHIASRQRTTCDMDCHRRMFLRLCGSSV